MLTVLLEFALVLGLMTGLAVLMGRWLSRVFSHPGHALPERLTYRLLGVDPRETMGWARYGSALLLSNGAMMLLGYLLLRGQGAMPINPLGLVAQTPDLAFNTAASFITNTNWQAYSGETSLSNFSQMAVITFLMFVGATSGVVAAAGFIRGFKVGILFEQQAQNPDLPVLRRMRENGHAVFVGRIDVIAARQAVRDFLQVAVFRRLEKSFSGADEGHAPVILKE